MGEAKRRKKSDPNYGKNVISVKLDSDLVLPLSLLKTQERLEKEKRSMRKGILSYREEEYPVIFLPFHETYRGKTQLYCHILFDPPQKPKSLNQREIDQISRLATLEIIAEEEKIGSETASRKKTGGECDRY